MQQHVHLGQAHLARALAPAVGAAPPYARGAQVARGYHLAYELATVIGPLVAHHLVARAAIQVGARKVTVEGTAQKPVAFRHGERGFLALQLVDGAAIGTHDRMHIVGTLKTPLDLERRETRRPHLVQALYGPKVLGAKRPAGTTLDQVVPLSVNQLVGKPAGLCARPTVCRAAATKRAHLAHARIAEAERAMAKALKLDPLLGDTCNLGK